MRLNKTLLAAAALVGASTVTSKAYDMYALDGALNPVWNYSQPNWSDADILVGQDFRGTFYQQLDSRLVNAGVYRGATGTFGWYWNVYWDAGSGRPDYAEGSLGTSDNAGPFDYSYDFQSTIAANWSFNFDSATNSGESTNIAIGQTWVGVYGGTNGDDDTHVGRSITVFERTVQVARTGAGAFGANVGSAFESDNYDTSAFYNDSIVGRNVLITATSGATQLTGSVVRQADIALGFGSSEGLFAKDGGWLDIRGDLTLGANGTIYIRDGEITSNIYTQYYAPGTLNPVGVITIQSGILSVRERFAQDMSATWNQTLGFRDGAVNSTRLLLEGAGYGFESGSQTVGPVGSSFGALRSITGENVQNGNISIVADGAGLFPGGGNGAVIGTDLGSKLTINGTVNGLNSDLSEGGAFLGYYSAGQTIQNGRILSGIDNITKDGAGELLLTASNLFTGDLDIEGGSVRITNSGALSGTSGETIVRGGASLILDVVSPATGLSLTERLRISGTGHADGVGALHNKSGVNATTGDLWVDSGNPVTSSATVTVASGSKLTVANLRGAASASSLTVDVSGSAAPEFGFFVAGNTGEIDDITKQGTGFAQIAQLAGDLNDINVNAGKLLVLGSVDSAADKIYDALDIDGIQGPDGKPLGEIEIRGTHHYGEFNIDGVDALITGSVTHHYDYDDFDIDITRNSTVTVDAGAFLISRGNSDSADIEDDSTLIIKGTFNAFDDSFIDLDDSATLDIRAGGVVNSFVLANDGSDVTIASADGEGLSAGVLNGSVRVYESATLTVGGTLNAVASPGRFLGIDAEGDSTVTISGTANGNSSFVNSSKLNVQTGGVLNGNVSLVDTPTLTLAGTVNGNITAAERVNFEDPFTKANITVSGTVNGNITLRGDVQTDTQLDPNPLFGLPEAPEFILVNIIKRVGGQTVPVDGQSSILDIVSGGTVNGDIFAYEDSVVTLRTGGSIVGNVDTFATARFVVEAGSTHIGDYTAQGTSDIVVNGLIGEGSEFAQNFRLQGSATLRGSGTITGSLEQTGGTVAPGNSTDVLTILGNYSISAGSLAIEIGGTDGPGNDPTGNDQLAVGGTVTVGGTAVLDFQPYNGVAGINAISTRESNLLVASSNVDGKPGFQVLATAVGGQIATNGRFSTLDTTGLDRVVPGSSPEIRDEMRIIFDHSTGKAYATGLVKTRVEDTLPAPTVTNAVQTFQDYGNTPNRREIGRALWMESIARDASGYADQNFASQAIDPLEVGPGAKVFILTSSGPGGVQQATGLGNGAVSVLTAADVGAALDALSPEAYVGVVDLGLRVTRNFAQLPASKRKLAAANEWDFSLGYAGEQLTVDTGAVGASNHKISSDQVNLTAAKDLSKNLRLTLAAGVDDGKVGSSNLTVDTDAQAFGLGLGFTPDSKGWTADLGLAVTRTDWTSSRGTSVGQSDNQDGFGAAIRLSLAPIKDGELSYAPYVGLSYADQEQDAVTETGTTAAPAVGFRGFDGESLVSELGLKAEYALKPGTTLTGVLAWEHDFEADDTTLDAEFAEDGETNTRFAVTSKGFGSDIFRVGVGVRVELGAKSAFSLGYDALLSSDAKSGQGVKADVSFRF